MSESPLHYRFAATHKVEPTPAMLIGQAVHCAVLEPDRFVRDFTIWDGTGPDGTVWTGSMNRTTNAYKAFAAANADKVILTEDEYTEVLAMRDSVRAHPVARKLLASGQAEVPLFWTDGKTGLHCKARLDWLRPRARVLVELKTTRNADPHSWLNTFAKAGYFAQVAFYLNGLKTVYGYDAEPYVIAVESVPPYDGGVFHVHDDAVYAGELLVERLLKQVVDCRKSRRWPGRYPDAQELTLPRWAMPDEEPADIVDLSILRRASWNSSE